MAGPVIALSGLGSVTENGRAGAGAPNADTIFVETLQAVKISHRKN